jgi:hypothetical protein
MPFKYSVEGDGFSKREVFNVYPPLTKSDWKEIRKVERRHDAAGWFRPPFFAKIEAEARQILKAAGYRTAKFRDRKFIKGLIRSRGHFMPAGPLWLSVPSGPESPDSGYALKLLRSVFMLRLALLKTGASNEIIQVLGEAFHLGSVYREHVLKREWEPKALHGEKFEQGRKKQRLDALNNVLLGLLPASNKEIWKRLKESIGKGVIEQVADGIVYWSRSPKGEAQSTSFKAIENRLTNLRKKYPSKKNPT